MKTVTLPKDAYQKLLERARLGERVLELSAREYPIEDYTDARIAALMRVDRVKSKTQQRTRLKKRA